MPEIHISTPVTIRKSRATGTDILTTIEIGTLNQYGTIDALYKVYAYGNFSERSEPEATDKVWRVRKHLAGTVYSGAIKTELTKQEALQLARDLAEKDCKDNPDNHS